MKVQISGHDKVVIRMSGKMNETADLEMIMLPKASSIEIDLIDLTLINSMGIRIFRNFALSISSPELLFSYCPRIFIDQVNMVADFIPRHSRILSFYVPYYNEVSGEEKSVLFTRNEQFTVENGVPALRPPLVQDSNGGEMEMDVVGERYFSFLRKF
jgi:hypothetical protein